MGNQLVEDLDKLRHAVGATARKRSDWGYRNYYNTVADNAAWLRLVALGLAVKGRIVPGGSTNFHATRDGCRAIGMTSKEVARACRTAPGTDGNEVDRC